MAAPYLFKVERGDGLCVGMYEDKVDAKFFRDRRYPIGSHVGDGPRVVRRGPDHRRGETGRTRHVRSSDGQGWFEDYQFAPGG